MASIFSPRKTFFIPNDRKLKNNGHACFVMKQIIKYGPLIRWAGKDLGWMADSQRKWDWVHERGRRLERSSLHFRVYSDDSEGLTFWDLTWSLLYLLFPFFCFLLQASRVGRFQEGLHSSHVWTWPPKTRDSNFTTALALRSSDADALFVFCVQLQLRPTLSCSISCTTVTG